MAGNRVMFGLVVAVVVVVSSFGLCSAKPGPRWHELEPSSYSFEDFKEDFSKSYATPAEEALRKAAFEENLARIVAHNRDPSKTWRMGVNHMADKPRHELIDSHHGYHKGHAFARRSGAIRSSSTSGSKAWESVLRSPSKALDRMTRMGSSDAVSSKPWYPYEVDWRNNGVVTAVKNQGQCGSCWAFSAAESLESALALATGELYDLSVQEFVTCTSNPHKCGGAGGCAGSVPQLAFDYAMGAGLTEEWSYSYRSFRGKEMPKDDCEELMGSNAAVRVGKVVGHYDIPSNDQEALMEAIAFRGPVSISVDASEWHFYEEGVFDGCNQTNPDLNHAVQLVGYGTDPKDGDYWLVRNSWSPVWGERGYIRLHRETTPRCGKDVTPLDGTGCEGGPPVQEVCGTCGILFDNTIPIVAGTEKPSRIKATTA